MVMSTAPATRRDHNDQPKSMKRDRTIPTYTSHETGAIESLPETADDPSFPVVKALAMTHTQSLNQSM